MTVPSKLVSTTHNSALTDPECQLPRWVVAECQAHATRRWIRVSCKARDCEACGAMTRRRIAERLAWGCRQWMDRGRQVAFLVLTFSHDVKKEKAVQRLASFVRILRDGLGHQAPYAATYELTENGRLHINLLVAGWDYIHHRKLARWWGHHISVSRVRSSELVGAEAAKTYSPEKLGGYNSKLDQAVPREWKRRVSYSRNWPKLPVQLPLPGVEYRLDDWPINREAEVRTGWLIETAGNVYRYRISADCDCYSAWEDNDADDYLRLHGRDGPDHLRGSPADSQGQLWDSGWTGA